ncbi:uncharacterized protein AB675_8280 [Cyphellophora attinorum]|uniref:Neuroguidin n=1 Tax=Cyphellophora attinorum TaxID=1664694 RepID=A0A0N1I071_9EURO|nr:uncharacterized protein AB675_8280 [Phialophora attinorum]KPI44745.1 hypothetical protein AB675_8280 [Phialophora attinorum]
MTVTDPSLSNLLETLTSSLDAATAALTDSAERFIPPTDGISLLDIKNDLVLSYLQNLAFLILFKIKETQSGSDVTDDSYYHATVERLVELRIYLERGVRPIEQRLKYTIDQYLQAANHKKSINAVRSSTGHIRDADASDDSGSEMSDGDAGARIESTADGDTTIHAPRLAGAIAASRTKPTAPNAAAKAGIYRPPRLNPTAMPSADPDARSSSTRQRKSQLMSEYIDEELSSAPTAQASIGANQTIDARGHAITSARDIARQRERTEYEETNFTRLAGETKKEKREKKRREGKLGARDMFGGEDWTGLGGMGDRIGRSVEGKGRDKDSVLKRREKRRATDDLPRGDGMQIGDSFAKKQRVLAGRADRRANKRR